MRGANQAGREAVLTPENDDLCPGRQGSTSAKKKQEKDRLLRGKRGPRGAPRSIPRALVLGLTGGLQASCVPEEAREAARTL